MAESCAAAVRITVPRSSISTRPPVACSLLDAAASCMCDAALADDDAMESAFDSVYWNVARTFPLGSRTYVCGWLNPPRSPNDVRIFGARGADRSKSHVRPAWNPLASRWLSDASTASVWCG